MVIHHIICYFTGVQNPEAEIPFGKYRPPSLFLIIIISNNCLLISFLRNCGEMQMESSKHKSYMHSNPCKSGSNVRVHHLSWIFLHILHNKTFLSISQIMYAWARDAPTLKLPNGVGFKVGGDSKINYLVLQVHYHRMFEG